MLLIQPRNPLGLKGKALWHMRVGSARIEKHRCLASPDVWRWHRSDRFYTPVPSALDGSIETNVSYQEKMNHSQISLETVTAQPPYALYLTNKA